MRALPILLLTGLMVPIEADAVRACDTSMDRVFEVRRGAQPIGTHSIRFHQDGLETQVDIDIQLRVGFGPFTMFRYEHRNREVWRDGKLVRLDTVTNDNGERFSVSARATPEGLQVVNDNETFVAPAETLPTSYWNKATLEQSELLDTQRGQLASIEVDPSTRQVIDLGTTSAIAQRADISGDLNLSVWYTEAGQLGRIAFTARGSEIDYQLICADHPKS